MASDTHTPRRSPVGSLPSKLTLGFIVASLALVAAFVYNATVVRLYLVSEWEWVVTRSDWLFMASTLFLTYVGARGLRNDDTRARLWKRLRKNPTALLGICFLAGLFLLGTVGAGYLSRPGLDYLNAYQPPVFASSTMDIVSECAGTASDGQCHGTWQYPLGTDANGYDLVNVVAAGAHVAVYVAVVTTAIIVPLGVLVGAVAGFYGGTLDSLLMRYVDVQQTIPAVVVYIVLILVLEKSLFMLLVVFGLFSWGGVARVVRSEVLQRRNAEYVLAGKGLGGGSAYLLRRHVLPNISHAVVMSLAQQIPLLLVTEAALAYLGLSAIDMLSWGMLVKSGLSNDSATLFQQWWVSGLGVFALTATVVAFKLVGDATRDVLDTTGG